MKIKILGTRGEIKISSPDHKKHAGILIDKKILIDCGEEKYLNYDPKIILITHLHPDHAFFISEKKIIDLNVPVYAPEEFPELKTIKSFKDKLFFSEYKITAIPVTHSLKVKSLGYLIEKGKTRIFYTGDIVEISRKYYKLLHDLDAVITEASFIRKGGVVRKDASGKKFGHAGVPDLVQLFKRFTSTIIFTHFGTWFIKNTKQGIEKLNRLASKNLSLEIAKDNSEYIF